MTSEPGTGRTTAEHGGTTAGGAVRAAAPARFPVVRVFGVLDVGGAELRTIELLPHLVSAGADVHFVTLSGRAGVLAPTVEGLGAQVHPMPLDLRFPVRFIRLLRRLRPRVVHSDVATFSGALLLLAALAGVPARIAHFRSDGDGHQGTVRRRVQRWAMRTLIDVCATDIVGVAPGALANGYRPSWSSDPRCRVVPNGLDLDRLALHTGFDLGGAVGAAPGEIVCLHVGRPSPAKRRWIVPRVVAALAASGVTAHGVLVGARDEDDERRVQSEARALGVEDRLHLLGPRDDVGSLMRQADVVLLPSDREGLPGVVLEALAVGTPVVASDLPGVGFIARQLPGVAVVGRDAAPAQWAAAVRRSVIRSPGERDREAAGQTFQASVFSLRSAVAEHLRMYRVPSAPRPDGAGDQQTKTAVPTTEGPVTAS